MLILPELTDLPQLAIPPYGAQIFNDFSRQKSFLVLYFRHEGGPRGKVLAWVEDVLQGLASKGIYATDTCEITLNAAKTWPDPPNAKTKWRCLLKVPTGIETMQGTGAQEV